jgi:hypothetical protein
MTSAPSLNRFNSVGTPQVVLPTTQISHKILLDVRKTAMLFTTTANQPPPIAFSDRGRGVNTAKQQTTIKRARAIGGDTGGTSLYSQNIVEYQAMRTVCNGST